MKPESGEVARPLHPFPHSFVFQLPPLFALCPLSLLLTVFAACCHGYSWSLMHSVTFLRGQLTLGAVRVERSLFERESEWITEFFFVLNHFSCFFFFPRPRAAFWRLWSNTWPPWRARRPRSWMQTPGRRLSHIRLSPHSITESKENEEYLNPPCVLQSIHLVQRRLFSLLHWHVL